MSAKAKAPLGASLIVLSSVFYASYGIWTKLTGTFFGAYTASAIRSVIVVLLLAPIAVAYRQLQPMELKRNWRYLTGLTIFSLVIWGPFYYAILHAGVGISMTIAYASIVLGMFVFGWLFLKERFTKDKLLSALLGIAGLILVFSPSLRGIGWLALGAALISGLATAANMVIAKQMPYNATQSTIWLWITSILANAIMALVFTEPMPEIGWHVEWFYLLIFAGASVAASWSFIRGVKLIDAGAAGILGLLEIVFGVLFGVLFFHERPGGVVLLGVVTIIVAASIPYVKDYKDKRGTIR